MFITTLKTVVFTTTVETTNYEIIGRNLNLVAMWFATKANQEK
jgi:hypothetical protein